MASSTGSGDITVSHFGHSVLSMRRATGAPSVRPCRTPAVISAWSCSNFIRAPRPYPARRRASAAATSAVLICTPAGIPSQIATSACPCDSPAVSQRNMLPILVRHAPPPRHRARGPQQFTKAAGERSPPAAYCLAGRAAPLSSLPPAGKEAPMSRQPYGMTTPEQRDQAADDYDEAAWQRDRAGTARDREAAERDRRGEARTQAALQYVRLTRARAHAPPGSRPGRAVSCRAERW